MAAKTGGTRRAPAAATKVAAGADVSPADVQETLIPAPVVETPLVDSSSAVEVLADLAGVPESVVEEIAAEVVEAAAATEQEAPVEDSAVARLAAIAALTGAPAPVAKAAVVVPEVAPNGEVVTWADGDEELASGVVTFDMLRAVVAGRPKQARKGTTVHAPEAVIARAEALGAVVRAD